MDSIVDILSALEGEDSPMGKFKREPRRIPRPTVGGVEADSNPVFYMCSYLC